MLIVLIVLIYGFEKLTILHEFGDSNLTEYSEQTYNANTTGIGFDDSKFSCAIRINSREKLSDIQKAFDFRASIT